MECEWNGMRVDLQDWRNDGPRWLIYSVWEDLAELQVLRYVGLMWSIYLLIRGLNLSGVWQRLLSRTDNTRYDEIVLCCQKINTILGSIVNITIGSVASLSIHEKSFSLVWTIDKSFSMVYYNSFIQVIFSLQLSWWKKKTAHPILFQEQKDLDACSLEFCIISTIAEIQLNLISYNGSIWL